MSLENEFGGQNPDSNGPEKLKAKTSLRLQYEAQAEVLRRQMGGLFGVQKQLGLSARRICQLLLVDPSAWSRWSKDEAQVPPHVWRALHWYFALQDKIPGLNASYFLGRDTENIEKTLEKKWDSQASAQAHQMALLEQQKMELASEVEELRKKVLKMDQSNRLMVILNMVGLILFLFVALWKG